MIQKTHHNIAIYNLNMFLSELKKYFQPELLKVIEDNCFIAGGCFTSLYHNEQPNDYDFFFKTQAGIDEFYKIINDGLANNKHFTDNMVLRLKGYSVGQSPNAVTFKFNNLLKPITIQFITFRADDVDKTLSNFDFYHSKIAYDLKTKDLSKHYKGSSLDVEKLMQDKNLVFDMEATHPINSIKRIAKFCNKGFKIRDEEILKIVSAIRLLNIDNDEKELEDQTRGLTIKTHMYDNTSYKKVEINTAKLFMDKIVNPKLKKLRNKVFSKKFNDILGE